MNECRDAIAALQAERDDISAKIYDPDQVREILEELTNQLDSLADKMKSGVNRHFVLFYTPVLPEKKIGYEPRNFQQK